MTSTVINSNARKWVGVALFVAAIVLGGAVFAWGFGQLTTEQARIAYDWTDRIYIGLQGGDLRYALDRGFHHPPWSMLPLLPLGFLSPGAGWGIIIYAYLLVLTLCVPFQRPLWRPILLLVLLLTSYVTIRPLLDGNLEILPLTGVGLLVLGCRDRRPLVVGLGVLLTSAKPQVGALVLLIAALYILRTWRPREWLKIAALVVPVVVLTFLWRGREWMTLGLGTGTIGWVGSGVLLRYFPSWFALPLLGLVAIVTLYILLRSDFTLTREKAGFIIAANLLFAPYGSVVSLLTVLAIGLIPIFARRLWLGLAYFALLGIPTLLRLIWGFTRGGVAPDMPLYFWNLPLFIGWMILAWHLYAELRQPTSLAVATVPAQG